MEALLYFICWGNQLLNIINSMQTNLTERVFGLPSVPRESLPSMFQILGWYPQQQIIETDNKPNEPEKIEVNQVVNVIQNPKQTVVETIDIKKDVGSPSRKRISKSMTKSGIYQIPDIKLKREYSLQKCQTVGTKIESSRKIIAKKILDPNNTEDVKQIEARKKRIKDFMYVTRDLPNSALTTYEGKPTWQVYGRANSNSNLLSHNVMPHRGQNHPKTLQSYFNALMKGKKLSQSTYVPKKPIQEIKQPVKQEHIEPINLPLQKPDLINHVRFTAINNREKKQNKIPTNKVTPLQKKNASKTAHKLKKKKQTIKKVQIDDDSLKFMNTRQNLLELLERKKTASSKLAWKITECYPFELDNQQKLKQTVEEWKHQRMAGKQSVRQESVGQLLKFSKQSPL